MDREDGECLQSEQQHTRGRRHFTFPKRMQRRCRTQRSTARFFWQDAGTSTHTHRFKSSGVILIVPMTSHYRQSLSTSHLEPYCHHHGQEEEEEQQQQDCCQNNKELPQMDAGWHGIVRIVGIHGNGSIYEFCCFFPRRKAEVVSPSRK